MLCPICNKPVDARNGKYFPPKGTVNRDAYCDEMGVSRDVFDHIETRRYMCDSHFDEELNVGGTRKKNTALPKPLNEEEKSFVLSFGAAERFRKPKTPTSAKLPKRPLYKVLTPLQNEAEPQTLLPTEIDVQINNNDEDIMSIENSESFIEVPASAKPDPKYVMVEYDKLMELQDLEQLA
uniref:THAP-type domain-containing protein n=1 Tax=Panagrolaimus superbus TaxID=310955 RepID=A0A914ZB83_9BILA